MAYLVANWSGSISFDSFLPSVLLWLVIIVAVVGVGVTVVVVVESSSVVKLSFVGAYEFPRSKASSVKVPVANVTLFSLAHLLEKILIGSFKPADEANCSFRTIEVERTGVPVGIIGTCHCCSLYFQSRSDTASNKFPNGSLNDFPYLLDDESGSS
ncbi:hypothetical protein Tco_0859719 [Tanacetum coccineum]|uniref:Uncharacterized protein n=1 Tax=Tanacetum coccineum TaxID=301880 RepID=A0ABQ5BF32_9ASTR